MPTGVINIEREWLNSQKSDPPIAPTKWLTITEERGDGWTRLTNKVNSVMENSCSAEI
jgi:hypothetical protein